MYLIDVRRCFAVCLRNFPPFSWSCRVFVLCDLFFADVSMSFVCLILIFNCHVRTYFLAKQSVKKEQSQHFRRTQRNKHLFCVSKFKLSVLIVTTLITVGISMWLKNMSAAFSLTINIYHFMCILPSVFFTWTNCCARLNLIIPKSLVVQLF